MPFIRDTIIKSDGYVFDVAAGAAVESLSLIWACTMYKQRIIADKFLCN